jgi:membrane protein
MRKHRDEESHGRKADGPGGSPAKDWGGIFKRTRKDLNEDNISLIAAGVAFFLLLSIVPALVAMISIYGLIADPQQVEQHFAQISGLLPAAVTDILSQQMKRIASDTQTAGWGAALGILMALWGASSAMKKLINGLNIAYKEEEKRGFFKLTFVTLLLTLGVVLFGLVAIAAITLLPAIVDLLSFGDSTLIAHLIRWPLLLFIALTGLAVVYRFAPSRSKVKWHWITPGAVLATVLWVLGSAGFSFYVANFGKYNETYGSLAAVVIMLLWLYLSTYVVLMGAELNSEIEFQTALDPTEESDRPRGKRGAHSVDDLGEAYA